MITMMILVAEGSNGEERQVLISEEEFKENGSNPVDFFVGNVSDAHVGGRIECDGDTQYLNGCYMRET